MDNKAPSVGSTLTNGIQDISALLPLLGTEKCEQHVGSGLSGGFLYVAATPMSIFGSLGMARAGFKGLIASISKPRWRFIGAQKLHDAGFTASGTNLSLIMMDPDHKRCHLAEARLDSLLKSLHIDDVERLTVVTRCKKWNLKMILLTAILSIISLTPYIYLNLNVNKLPLSTRWVFPITRVVGGFLIATSLQLLIQRRLVSLLKARLTFRALDAYIKTQKTRLPDGVLWDPYSASESCLWSLEHSLGPRHKDRMYDRLRLLLGFGTCTGGGHRDGTSLSKEFPQKSALATEQTKSFDQDLESGNKDRGIQPIHLLRNKLAELKQYFGFGTETMWPFFILVTLGIVGSVAGYIGCFSVVQGSTRSTGPLIWLATEAVLSIIRMALWGWNSDHDNLDPLILSLKLHRYPPFPTCNLSESEIRHNAERTLLLVRASEFLESITAYAGLVKRFDSPNLSLFYTLTRRAAEAPGIRQQALYITIFDHKERTTRIYYEDADSSAKFLSADGLYIDTKHNILTTTILDNLDADDDPVICDQNLQSELQEHYRSILGQLRSRLEHPERDTDDIVNSWTLVVSETETVFRREVSTAYLSGGSMEDAHDTTTARDPSPHESSKRYDVKVYEEKIDTDQGFEMDDAEYLKQGRFQQKTGDLFYTRMAWIEGYMRYVTKCHAAKIEDQIPAHEVETYKEFQEYALLYERGEMEYLLLDEMQRWEEILRTEHHRLLESVKKKRASDTSWPGLEKRMERDWYINAWLRLSRYKGLIEERLAKETARVDEVVGSGWEQELRETWRKARLGIQAAWRHQLPLSMEVPTWAEERGYVLGPLLKSMTLNAIYKPEDDATRANMRKMYDAMVEDKTRRLESEKKDLDHRVKREHLGDCDDFGAYATSAELIFGPSKWTEVYHADILLDDGLKAIPHALRRNKRVFFIQFTGYDTDLSNLANSLSIIYNTPSVTTVAFSPPNMEIGEANRAALLEGLSRNRTIVSICGLDVESMPEIKQQLTLNQAEADVGTTPTVAHGFLIPRDDDKKLSGGCESRIDLRWIGPKEEPLLLNLQHQFTKPPRIRINNAFEIPCPIMEPGSSDTQTVRLEPIRDFKPDSPNVLSIIPADEDYRISDVDLCDEQGESILTS